MDVMPIEPWRRAHFAPGAPNVFQLFCFAKAPLTATPEMSALRFGLPSSAAMNGVEVRELPRSADADWFDGFRSGSLRVLASQSLGADLARLDEADVLVAILISRDDAADLQHLQAGWAVAKWLVARGVTVVLDAQANRYWKGTELSDWSAHRPFLLSAEVNVIVEAEPEATIATVHTRGLAKCGRPDLVVLDVPASRWDAVAGIVRVLAGQLADGRCFAPGEHLRVGEDPITFEHFDAKHLHLNNEALRVVSAAS